MEYLKESVREVFIVLWAVVSMPHATIVGGLAASAYHTYAASYEAAAACVVAAIWAQAYFNAARFRDPIDPIRRTVQK